MGSEGRIFSRREESTDEYLNNNKINVLDISEIDFILYRFGKLAYKKKTITIRNKRAQMVSVTDSK